MTQKPDSWYQQSAVIPYRVNGRVRSQAPLIEVMLITSRKRKRWVIPKGIIEPGMTPQESALKEAYEEAGIRGNVSATACGVYFYEKWQGICRVEVFLLEVTEVLPDWPEAALRDREWMTFEEAANRVRENDLKQLLLKIPHESGDM
jgi:8-oxo-dGTP pyrophosphatase MutT (NUDIX family)